MSFLQRLVEQCPVGKTGKRIIMRKLRQRWSASLRCVMSSMIPTTLCAPVESLIGKLRECTQRMLLSDKQQPVIVVHPLLRQLSCLTNYSFHIVGMNRFKKFFRLYPQAQRDALSTSPRQD